jgi:hypothetical protein
MRLFEWAVATGPGPETRHSPVGVTGQQMIARTRLVDALLSLPYGTAAQGWITVMGYVPASNGHQRFCTPVRAELEPGGSLRWISEGDDA